MQVSHAAAVWLEYHRSHPAITPLNPIRRTDCVFGRVHGQADRRNPHRRDPLIPKSGHGGQEPLVNLETEGP